MGLQFGLRNRWYPIFESRDLGAFTGKILSAMRSEFGGHAEKKA